MTSGAKVVTMGICFSEQQIDGRVGHAAAMLDAVDAKLGDTGDAVVVGGVRGDGQAVAVALVDDRGQFLVGELQRVVAGHDLDQVGAAAHLLAHGAAHLVGAARLAAAPVGVPAGLDDRLAADEQARSGKDALFDRLLGKEVGPGSCPGRARW